MLVDPLSEALRLADLGLAVHWLWGPDQGPEYVRATKPGKCPARKKWQDRPALTPGELRREYRPGRNLGLHTGLVSGAKLPLVALDIDGEQGFIFCQQQKIPCSPVRTVTRNGQHWLYRHPGRGCAVPTRQKIDPDRVVDIRGERGNLVLPPSQHASGFVYAPVEPWARRLLAQVPTWDPAWIPAPPAKEPPRWTQARPVFELDADVLKRARRAMQNQRPSIQGQNGSTACFIAACTLLKRYQLSPAQALEVLTQEFNPRCVPPWSARELQHKVESAARRLGVEDR